MKLAKYGYEETQKNVYFLRIPSYSKNFVNFQEKYPGEIAFLNKVAGESAGPNSIPTKILRLLTDDISDHFSIIFNTSFATGMCPEKLKVAKVIPIHKKDSKRECSKQTYLSSI